MIEDASKIQTIHRVKHIPSGLYYQPGENNFSEKGKIYNNNQDCITHETQYIWVTMLKNSRLVTKYPNVFADWEDAKWDHRKIYKSIPLEEFIQEPLNN